MSTAAGIANTAIVSSSSISVSPRRLPVARKKPAPGRAPSAMHLCLAFCRLVQPGCFDRCAGMGGLVCAAAEQFVLLLQQLLDFPQLANLFSPLFDRIGKWGQAPLRLCPERAVET